MRGAAAILTLLMLLSGAAARAEGDGGTQAEAEQALQSYLALWSDDGRVTAEAVRRFYAPSVSYYGHAFTRAQVFADKQAFVRSYPRRGWSEVPGSFAGTCNADRSRCRVTVLVDWRRTDRRGVSTSGRSRLAFTFEPAEGGRKIVRESARTL